MHPNSVVNWLFCSLLVITITCSCGKDGVTPDISSSPDAIGSSPDVIGSSPDVIGSSPDATGTSPDGIGDSGNVGGDSKRGEDVPDTSSGGCQDAADCPVATPVCDKGTCVECATDDHCPSAKPLCVDGGCLGEACVPNIPQCVENEIHVCSPDGTDPDFEIMYCGDQACHDGHCVKCVPESVFCVENTVVECFEDGQGTTILETCEASMECSEGKCGECPPGAKKCNGEIASVCSDDGVAWDAVQDCSLMEGMICKSGECLSPCDAEFVGDSNAGCIFWAVDLDNAEEGTYDAQHAQFAVIASNASQDLAVKVTVKDPSGDESIATLPPLSLQKFELPATWSQNGTNIGNDAFKITATGPITAYQFNPLSNIVEVFSNDASLLLPSPKLGSEYYVMSFKQYATNFRGFFTVVGISSAPTEVTFTPTCKTLAGGEVPALSKGQSHTVTLLQGEVLNIETDVPDGDLTGTHITANLPIAVFAGHEATNTLDECCADHLEQQMLPVNTWGTNYVVTKSWQRWKEKDHVRILAGEDGTEIVVSAPDITVPTLSAGEFFHFQSAEDLQITSTKPIMVAQYLASSYEILGGDCPAPFAIDPFYDACIGPSCSDESECASGTTCEFYLGEGACAPIGDPSMILAASVEQFLDSYVFLTPDAYLEDYLNVLAPLDAEKVVLDGNQLNAEAFLPVGDSGFGVYRTMVSDGVHHIWSESKFGIVVYGYDDDVSYGYPGGIGLKQLED